jgi:hypothetical protein
MMSTLLRAAAAVTATLRKSPPGPDITDPDLRRRLLLAMRAETNVWEFEFSQTAHAIALGLLDGSLPECMITDYPQGEYPELLSKFIAHRVGLPFHTDTEVWSGGWRLNVDAEAIGLGVRAVRSIPAGDADIEGGAWWFYAETLERHELTIGQVRAYMAGLTLGQAAELIVEADAVPIEQTR